MSIHLRRHCSCRTVVVVLVIAQCSFVVWMGDQQLRESSTATVDSFSPTYTNGEFRKYINDRPAVKSKLSVMKRMIHSQSKDASSSSVAHLSHHHRASLSSPGAASIVDLTPPPVVVKTQSESSINGTQLVLQPKRRAHQDFSAGRSSKVSTMQNSSFHLSSSPTPQDLLLAVHVGFSKCGSTSFQDWFHGHSNKQQHQQCCHITKQRNMIVSIQLYGCHRHPERFHHSWKKKQAKNKNRQRPVSSSTYVESNSNLNSSVVASHPWPRIIIKDPEIITREWDLHLLRSQFPLTKVLVGIRHPVLWFLSFYNFRTIDRPKGHLPHPSDLIGPCIYDAHVCTDHARFHYYLARAFTRTPMTSEREFKLLYHGENVDDDVATSSKGTTPSSLSQLPNVSVFLYETMQLEDTNATRAWQFRRDVSHFLHLDPILPPPPATKPETRLSNKRYIRRAKHLIRDFCIPEYHTLRQILMQHAQNLADWLEEFLLLNLSVVSSQNDRLMVSSPDYFRELNSRYRQDPLNCSKNTS